MIRNSMIQTISLTVLLLLSSGLTAKNYYVDALRGNDKNNGTTIGSPWKTLKRVSSARFEPGDVISFASQQRFTGVLSIPSGGSREKPVIFTTYGGFEPAIIDGQGDSAAIYAFNKEYFELKNLAVTNARSGEITQEDLFNGILIVNHDAGTLNHIHLDAVRVFNVNSTYLARDEGKTDQSRYHGGVQIRTTGTRVRSNFNDVIITNSTFENLSRTGVNFRSDWDDRSAYSKFGDKLSNGLIDNWTPNTGVVIRNNIFRNIAGNGLIVRVAVGALIERNLFDTCGKIISGNAAFNFNTDHTVYQYNEARNTIYNEGDTDARGIDSDYRTKHTIIQYNHLHNNGLGGVIVTGGPGLGDDPVNFNLGTIVRYNIIENNDRQGFYASGRVEGLLVHDNLFYADSLHNDILAVKLNRWTVYPDGVTFKNNIFHFEGKRMGYDFTRATNVKFDQNLFVGIQPPVLFPESSGIRYLDSLFDQVTVEKDLLFRETVNYEGKREKLKLDIYSPEGDTLQKRPVIMWIHGGGFRPGNDKSQSYIVRMATEFAQRGYVGVSVDYRVRNAPREDPQGTMKDALDDAMAGLNWIRENASRLKVDASKIIVAGGSAGGMLANNLCFGDDSGKEQRNKSGIIGLVNLWGTPDSTFTFFDIDRQDPPTIIVHGTADALVSYGNSVKLTEKLKQRQVKHKLVTIEGAGHTPASHIPSFSKEISLFLHTLITNVK